MSCLADRRCCQLSFAEAVATPARVPVLVARADLDSPNAAIAPQEVDRTNKVMNDEIKARIANYRSPALDEHPRRDEIHDIARKLTQASNPTDLKMAGTTMTWLTAYFRWVADREWNSTLDSGALNPGWIAEFLDVELADRSKGSVDAARSFLRRCIPGATIERRPTQQPTRPFPPDLSTRHVGRSRRAAESHTEIEAAVLAYRPDGMEDADWDHISDTCIDWTLRTEPTTSQRALMCMTQLSWPLEWALEKGRPFEDLLTPGVMEAYFADGNVTRQTQSAARSVVNAVIAAVHPERTWKEHTGTGAVLTAPYADDQIEWFWTVTEAMSAKTGRAARALLALIAGAGVSNGSDARFYSPQDFAEQDGAISVTNTDRDVTIPVAARWQAQVREVLDERDGDGPLLGSGSKNRAYDIVDSLRTASGMRLDLARLHSNWLLHAVTTPNTMTEILAFDDRATLASFDKVLPYAADHLARNAAANTGDRR